MRQERAKKTRGKSRAHKAHGRQTAKAAIKHAGRETTPRNAGKEKPQKADMTAGSLTHSRRTAAPPCTPARQAKQAKQRQKKPCTHKRTAGKRQAGPGSADQTRPGTKAAGCPQAGDKAAEHRQKTRQGTGRKSQQARQRQVSQKRLPRQAARHAGRRKTPPNRQNSRSLFCLPGGAL